MKEKRLNYPVFKGGITAKVDGNKYKLLFDGRSINVETTDAGIRMILTKISPKERHLRTVRHLSSNLSRFGLTIKLEDEDGPLLSIGKGVWTPLGHFSIKARARKYLKKER